MHLQTSLLYVLASVTLALSENECPDEFLRLSDHHSYCQPPNPQCQVLYSGISEEDKNTIVDTHNQLRNKVAVGDDNAEGLPTGSDMLQMVWDDNLAAIAQTYAYQCKFEHDCNACRSTADFSVGQNLGKSTTSCQTDNCAGYEDDNNKVADWKSIIELFYKERKYVTPAIVQSYVFGEKYGHFSQLAWAKTWKVGCGYSVYVGGGSRTMSRLYVCNYAIAANLDGVPIYESGAPCSHCPENSCCGSSCDGNSYTGLCSLGNPNKYPVWDDEDGEKNIIYDCRFESDCVFGISGTNNWLIYDRAFGKSLLAVMSGGETTTLDFWQPIKPGSEFCLVMVVRKGPNVAGQQESGDLTASIQMGNYDPWVVEVGFSDWSDFAPSSYSCWNEETTFKLTYTIPQGVPQQYVEIKRIYGYTGSCS